jgi:hypothetical protein
VLKYAEIAGKPYLEAGRDLCLDQGRDELKAAFGRGDS